MGIFWDDPPGKKLKNCAAYIMPDIPDTGWEMPREFPNLQHAKCLAIDVETYDPELIERGPGWARGKGHLVGVSIAADGFKGYYPMRHEVDPHINIPPDKVLAWLNDVLSNEHAPKLGANIMYDVGWLRQEGVDVKGKLIDLQYAEALLTEDGKVGLEHLGQKYLGLGKESSDLYKWCAAYYGGAANDRQRKNIYRAPARLVGHYAESDATLPFKLAGPMYRALERDGLLDVFDMECRLIPLLIDMRFAGVSVDINRAEQARVKLLSMADEAAAQIRHIVGFDVNVNAAASLAKAFDKIGLKYPRTAPSASYPEGQPSFTKLSLKATDHKVARLIEDQKKYLKTVGTFIDGAILDAHVGGKIYPLYHPLRGDDNGTRSGRLSCTKPNAQQMPSRDKIITPLLRGLFIPHPGHKSWISIDYGQIEYRMLLQFACGKGSDEIRSRFNAETGLDFHNMSQQMILEKTGIKLDRKYVKNTSFGLLYGMSKKTLANNLGLNRKKADKLFDTYHTALPFVAATMDRYKKLAAEKGEVKTILGRKSRFTLWVPKKYDEKAIALPYERALSRYGHNIMRAYTHKGINRVLQGSSADQMKMAMVKMHESGVLDAIGPPVVTVHDEADISNPGGPRAEEAIKEIVHIMKTAIKLRVPVEVDVEEGPNWAEIKEVKV